MKFRVERDVLAEAVTWVARGLPSHPPVPVLAGVLIEASDEGTLTFSAFDYEVSAKITVAAEVGESGTVLVLGRLLADISRNLPDRPIDVVTEGSKVQVTCGSTRFSLLMMPADDYPTLPTAPASTGTIAGDVFTHAVAQVSIAADRGDTLPILTGVRVEIEGDKITLLATDRYRLAMRELTWNPEATDASHVALVPARTLSDTAKALGALGSIEIHLGSGASGAQSFRESALGAEFELEFTGEVLPFEFTIFAYVTRDHLANLALLEQQAKAPVVNACVVTHNYQVLPGQRPQS